MLNFYLFILRETERVHKWGRKRERERHRQTDRIPSRLCTDSSEPDVGLQLRNHEIMT